MKRVTASLLAMLFVFSAPILSASYAVDTEFIEGLTLFGLVERSAIVTIGTVVDINYVTRPSISSEGATTDITLRIDDLIKGKANFGDDHIIFMIEGGVYYSTYAKKRVEMLISDQPKFEVGEQVLVFLGKFDPYSDYAHDGLHLIHGELGKKKLYDDRFRFWYLHSKDRPIAVAMSKELVSNLAKAYVSDHEAAKLLEARIKTLAFGNKTSLETGTIIMSNALETKLLGTAKQILNRRKDK